MAQMTSSDDPAATSDKISAEHVRKWLNTVGDLPRSLDLLLTRPKHNANIPIRDIEILEEDLDDIEYIYVVLRLSVKLFTKTPISEFLSKLTHFFDGNTLIYLTFFRFY